MHKDFFSIINKPWLLLDSEELKIYSIYIFILGFVGGIILSILISVIPSTNIFFTVFSLTVISALMAIFTYKRDWFDTNSAFAAIDAALHSAVTGQASDAEAISTINGKLADDEADIAALQTKGNTHDSQIAALQTTVNTQASQIQDVRQDAEDMITANNEGAAATSTSASRSDRLTFLTLAAPRRSALFFMP